MPPSSSPAQASPQELECPICLERLTTENAVILTCGHMFTADCIQQLNSEACPACAVCKRPFTASECVRVFNGIPSNAPDVNEREKRTSLLKKFLPSLRRGRNQNPSPPPLDSAPQHNPASASAAERVADVVEVSEDVTGQTSTKYAAIYPVKQSNFSTASLRPSAIPSTHQEDVSSVPVPERVTDNSQNHESVTSRAATNYPVKHSNFAATSPRPSAMPSTSRRDVPTVPVTGRAVGISQTPKNATSSSTAKYPVNSNFDTTFLRSSSLPPYIGSASTDPPPDPKKTSSQPRLLGNKLRLPSSNAPSTASQDVPTAPVTGRATGISQRPNNASSSATAKYPVNCSYATTSLRSSSLSPYVGSASTDPPPDPKKTRSRPILTEHKPRLPSINATPSASKPSDNPTKTTSQGTIADTKPRLRSSDSDKRHKPRKVVFPPLYRDQGAIQRRAARQQMAQRVFYGFMAFVVWLFFPGLLGFIGYVLIRFVFIFLTWLLLKMTSDPQFAGRPKVMYFLGFVWLGLLVWLNPETSGA